MQVLKIAVYLHHEKQTKTHSVTVSTSDFGSFSRGSNPCESTNRPTLRRFSFLYPRKYPKNYNSKFILVQIIKNPQFHEQMKGKKDYYFGSLAAMFEHFLPEEIGVSIQTLYNAKIEFGSDFKTKNAIIRKDKLIRKNKENL